jgi:hypothetical protein
MPFDVQGARAAGYSDAEIADELAKDSKFDTAGARAAGYSDAEIINELQPPLPPATAADRFQAAAGGLGKGFAYTLGLPADFGINLADVGSAAVGAGYLLKDKLTGKPEKKEYTRADLPIQLGDNIPTFVKPVKREDVPLSSQNIQKGMRAVGLETEPVRPDDRISRYLNNATALGSGLLFGGIYNKLAPQAGPGSPPVPPPAPRPGQPPLNPPTNPPVPPAPAPGQLGGPQLPAPLGLNATEQATLAAGERLGLRATPGARLGSPQLRQIEAKLESYPSTSGPLLKLSADNGRVVQREFLKAIGESGDEVSSQALANAAQRIGKVFDDAAANNKVAYDAQLESQLSQIGQRAALELTEAEGKVIQNQLGEIVNKAAQAGGAIDGPAFQSIYSALGRISGGSGTGGTRVAAGEIRDALHDALIRSAGPKAAGKLTEARNQYRNLLTAEKSGAIDPGSGTVRAGQLANAFARSDKNGYLRGYNDSGLYDALRFANTRTFGPIVGNSGTATRLGNPNGAFDASRYLLGNLGARAYLAGGNTALGRSALNSGVNAANATRDYVRRIAGIPTQQALPGIIIGTQPIEDELARGLYQ